MWVSWPLVVGIIGGTVILGFPISDFISRQLTNWINFRWINATEFWSHIRLLCCCCQLLRSGYLDVTMGPSRQYSSNPRTPRLVLLCTLLDRIPSKFKDKLMQPLSWRLPDPRVWMSTVLTPQNTFFEEIVQYYKYM